MFLLISVVFVFLDFRFFKNLTSQAYYLMQIKASKHSHLIFGLSYLKPAFLNMLRFCSEVLGSNIDFKEIDLFNISSAL